LKLLFFTKSNRYFLIFVAGVGVKLELYPFRKGYLLIIIVSYHQFHLEDSLVPHLHLPLFWFFLTVLFFLLAQGFSMDYLKVKDFLKIFSFIFNFLLTFLISSKEVNNIKRWALHRICSFLAYWRIFTSKCVPLSEDLQIPLFCLYSFRMDLIKN